MTLSWFVDGWPATHADAEKLAAATNPDGQQELFWIAADGSIQHRVQQGSAWSAAAPLGGTAKEIAAGNNADGRIEIFYIGTDNQLYHRVQITTGWSGELAFGTAANDLAIARNADGRLELFYTTADNAIFHTAQNAPNSAWGAGAALGGKAIDLAVGPNKDGRLELFYVSTGAGSTLLHRVQLATGGWSDEKSFGINGIGDLAVGRDSGGRLDVFYTVGASNLVYHLPQTTANGAWGSAAALGGRAVELAVGANADGRLELFYIGTGAGAALFHRVEIATGWSSEISFGATGVADLAVGRTSSDARLALFSKTTGGALQHATQLTPNGSWSGVGAL